MSMHGRNLTALRAASALGVLSPPLPWDVAEHTAALERIARVIDGGVIARVQHSRRRRPSVARPSASLRLRAPYRTLGTHRRFLSVSLKIFQLFVFFRTFDEPLLKN
jgi:hypothetical protein